MRSGSASRTATSVMAEDIRRSSCARQTRIARNQNSAMGMMTVAMTATMAGLESRSAVLPEVSKCLLEDGPGQNQAEDEPDDRGDERDQKRRPRRPLLQRVDQAADGRHVVVGGNMRRAPEPPDASAPAGRPLRRRRYLDGVAAASS